MAGISVPQGDALLERDAPGTPARPANPLVGTYWWRTVSHADYAWDNRALYFVDATTVYSGFPPGGLPPTCATAPAKPEQEVDQREGCLPYTYDAASGAVTIGDKAGTFKDGRLTIDANAYDPLKVADAGARFDVRDLEHTDFSGQCLSWLGCTVSRKFLTLQPDGQFALSTSTTSSSGDPGQGPFTGVASFPPDQRGTYEVLPSGRIRLAFADGSVREETFAILTSPTTRRPDPVGEGVMVGKDNFYPDPSPGS